MNSRNHRLGRFTISNPVMDRWEDLLPLMGNMVVVQATFRYDLAAIEYLAYSPLFDEIDPNTAAPEYDLIVFDNVIPANIRAVKKGDLSQEARLRSVNSQPSTINSQLS